jgi:hypothetical protein
VIGPLVGQNVKNVRYSKNHISERKLTQKNGVADGSEMYQERREERREGTKGRPGDHRLGNADGGPETYGQFQLGG